MIDRTYWTKNAAHRLGMLAVLALLVTTWLGAVTSVSAQDNGGMVIGATLSCDRATECGPEFAVQVTVTAEDGEFLGTCTVEGNIESGVIPACALDFPFRPTGTLVVTQDVSTLPAGYAPEENPIRVDTAQLGRASHDVVFRNVRQAGNATAGQTSDVAIATSENGQSATDVCYVLVDYSNEGCDENDDGQVTFQDVPLGTYTVRQTADLGPGRFVPDFVIDVTGTIGAGGWEVFSTTVNATSGGSVSQPEPSGSVDIALITRDPDDGHLLTGACYVLVDYSNEGCDENGDGQVTFAAIPYGAYTVHQTRTPAGYPTINDYDIYVEPVEGMPEEGSFDVPLGFIVKQAPEQNAPDTRNVSVVLIDMTTHEKVAAGVCVELVGASNVGCDDDVPDGQIDFLDVSAGDHAIDVTTIPDGYTVIPGRTDVVSVDASAGTFANVFHVVGLQTRSGSSGGTGSGGGVSGQESWTASVQVNLCDAPPGSGSEMNCHAEGGTVVNISLASGERLGSCTVGEPQATPWGVSISTCTVAGLPFNADVVATQDPSTIPAGYAPYNDPLSLQVGSVHPGGGDQATFTFFDIRTDAGSTGSGGTSGSGNSTEATILMTFRGCPEGFVPDVDDPYTACMIPLDAPDASVVGEWGDGQSLVPITGLERQYDGAYIFHASSDHGYYLELTGLEPVLRDDFLIYGVDDRDGSSYITLLDNGETREIFVFYYYE